MKIPALLLVLTLIVCVPALDAKEDEDPIFVQWMSETRAKDQTILTYWEKAKKHELSSEGLVDLGTMLFRRGFPDDAIDMYELAIDKKKDNPEAWYRMGLVEHKKGDLRKARKAYQECLKLMSGHGWCNFYLGYLEENSGNPSEALAYYATAFRHAPELADPEVNPEVLYSRLYVGALVKHTEDSRFARAMPMPYLEPGKVHGTTKRMKRSIDAQRQEFESQDATNSAKTEPIQPTPEKNPKPAIAEPVAPPASNSTSPTKTEDAPPPQSTQDAKAEQNFTVHTASSAKKTPQRRRPGRQKPAPVPQPDPNAEPDQPETEKPPTDPNEG